MKKILNFKKPYYCNAWLNIFYPIIVSIPIFILMRDLFLVLSFGLIYSGILIYLNLIFAKFRKYFMGSDPFIQKTLDEMPCWHWLGFYNAKNDIKINSRAWLFSSLVVPFPYQYSYVKNLKLPKDIKNLVRFTRLFVPFFLIYGFFVFLILFLIFSYFNINVTWQF